jgi:hypothetical protein
VTTRHFTEMATYLTDGVSKDMFKKPYSDSYRLTDIDYYLNIFSYAAFGLQEYGGSLSNWPNNFYYVLTHKKPSGPRLPQRLIGRVISAIIKGQ